MQNEIFKRPLVDILSETLGRSVVMNGTEYVVFEDNSIVAHDVVSAALVKQAEMFVKEQNDLKVKEAKKYLLDTDFYYARKLESGEEVPSEVVAKRIEMRELVRSFEV